MDFITFYDDNKIILAVFPFYATHKLQPLDVVLYGPLSKAYNKKLTTYLCNSQGLLVLKKGDFFLLFWDAWTLSFTAENIISSFKYTGINPMDSEVVLKQLKTSTPQESKSSQKEEISAGGSWRQIHNLIVSTVKDTGSQEAKQFSNVFHLLQTQSELKKHENKGLRAALDTKKKCKEKKYTLGCNVLYSKQGEGCKRLTLRIVTRNDFR
jgi:hypothetical protein